MRVLVQYRKNLPVNTEAFQAETGFHRMGIETGAFCTVDEFPETDVRDLVVGGIDQVRHRLGQLGVEIPELNYPEALREYLGRPVWRSSLDKVLWSDDLSYPVFVKPIKEKLFAGTVLRGPGDYVSRHAHCRDNEPVWVSPEIEFRAEWRVFVRYGKILDARPYYGDWRLHFKPTVIEDAVLKYTESGEAPAAYAIDFGVDDRGRTLLVEVNDGYSTGSYGLDDVDYAKYLSARWCQLVGVDDPCHFD